MKTLLALASLLVATAAFADEPADAEDPKAAIADRGIVLKAGKRNYFVVVPPANPPPETPKDSVFYKSRLFYGDAKSLFELRGDWDFNSLGESRSLGQDPRWINTSTLWRKGETYELQCGTTFKQDKIPTIALALANRSAVAKSVITDPPRLRLGYLFARQSGSTTYIYVDLPSGNTTDFRLFIGKRGAMKQIPIKESANDSTSLVLVTSKGTLSITKATAKGEKATGTFGPAKKPAAIDILPIDANRLLIYRELGIYTRDKTGQPCDEL